MLNLSVNTYDVTTAVPGKHSGNLLVRPEALTIQVNLEGYRENRKE